MTKKANKPMKQRRTCFSCNGTKQKRDACGESLDVCECEDAPSTMPCSDCNGTGIAWNDLTPEERKAK